MDLIAPNRRIYTIEWLRAIAATLVVLFHTSQGIEFRTGNIISPWTDFGACGVDIFFVISGFIMTVTNNRGDFRIPDFLVKRAIRILPVYWILTLAKAASLLAMPSLVLFSVFSAANVATSMLLVPYFTPGRGLIPLIIVAWSLELEIAFYLAFALCRSFAPSRWPAWITAIFLVLGSFHLLGIGTDIVQFYARPIIVEFLFGIGIGLLHLRGTRIPAGVACGTILCAVLVLATAPSGSEADRFLIWGVPSALIVAAIVGMERRFGFWSWPPMVFLGNSSYSLYLTHTLAVPFIMLPLRALHPGVAGSFAFLAAAMVVQIGIGCAAFLVLERPLTGLLQRRYRLWQPVAAKTA